MAGVTTQMLLDEARAVHAGLVQLGARLDALHRDMQDVNELVAMLARKAQIRDAQRASSHRKN